MEQRFVLRGFAAGALGGLFAFAFGRVMAEPLIQRAIDYASGRDAAEQALRRAAGLAVAAPDPELFSRGLQRNLGFGAGMVLFGIAMGGLFAVTYVLATRGMRPSVRPRTVALAIAAAGFAGVFLLPFLKYPANPPGVGHPDTIYARGLLYLAMVGISVVSVIAAVLAARRLSRRLGGWNATLLALLGLAVWLAIVTEFLPSLGHLHANQAQFGNLATETPPPLRNRSGAIVYPGFPADLLYQFRLYAVIAQLILWGTIGVGFGAFAERLASQAGRGAALDSRAKGELNVLAN
jgi:Probable cobalt transporter subunit (CbtA)